MPTRDDWMSVTDPMYRESVGWFFELDPGLLATGNIEEGILCRLDSPNVQVEPIIIPADRLCLEWGECHDETLWGEGWRARNAAMRTINNIKRIKREELVRLEGYARNGRKILRMLDLRMLETPREATLETAETALNRPVHRLTVTSWLGGTATG